MTTLLSLQNAAFGYNGRPILSELTLEIQEGEFVGLIGPNGAGKSTLLRGLLGLIEPLRGTLVRHPEVVRQIGYVPQRKSLDSIYPLTAQDVVLMGAEGQSAWDSFSSSKMKQDSLHSLEKVGMKDRAGHPFSELSSGQQQRVLIARALMTHPRLLMLDEPTAGVDPEAEEEILSLLSALHSHEKIAVLMVSHDIPSLKSIANRIWVVKNHRVSPEVPV